MAGRSVRKYTRKSRKSGGGKRSRRSGGGRKSYRKGTRSVRKTGRAGSTWRKRPTPTSIFKDNEPLKIKNIVTGRVFADVGIQGSAAFFCTPNTYDLQQAFSYVNNNAAFGTLAPQTRIALCAKRRDEFRWTATASGYLTTYRIKARNNIPLGASFIAVNGTSYNLSTANVSDYILGLWNYFAGANVKQQFPTGGKAISPCAVIGVTPYDSPQFCSNFKICKVSTKRLKFGQVWRKSYLAKPRLLEQQVLAQNAILEGQYIDLYVIRGDLGRDGSATNGVSSFLAAGALSNGNDLGVGQDALGVNSSYGVTTAPVEMCIATTWDYQIAQCPVPTAGVSKQVINQFPNPAWITSAANVFADDASFLAPVSSTSSFAQPVGITNSGL